MHSLEVIVRRNAHAAGREEGHARNDGEHARAHRILAEGIYGIGEYVGTPGAKAYDAAYTRARQEG